ncbi:MFS transporter [Natrialbaceae archaeon A-CW1-1]
MNQVIRAIKNHARTIAQELWFDGRGWILIAVSAGWALSMGVRYVFPTLAPFIQSEFNIGLSATGLLLSLLWGAYAIGNIPGGVLGDRIGEGNILVLSTAITAGATLIVATAVDVWVLFVGTIVFGLSTALYGPSRFTLLTDIYSKHSGSAIGLTMAAGSLGNTVFPALSAIIATYLSWRLGFGIFIPLFVIVVIVLWLTVPGRTSSQTSVIDEISIHSLKRITRGITHNYILVFVLTQITVAIIIQGFSSFYPSYLINVKDLTPGAAATLFGIFFAAGIVIQPISGSMMERSGPRNATFLCLGGCVLALWMLPFFDSLMALIVITCLLSCLNGCSVITQTYIADALPQDMQGTGFGTLKAGWMIIGATSPLFIGILADFGYFDQAFLLLALIGTIGVVTTLKFMPNNMS